MAWQLYGPSSANDKLVSTSVSIGEAISDSLEDIHVKLDTGSLSAEQVRESGDPSETYIVLLSFMVQSLSFRSLLVTKQVISGVLGGSTTIFIKSI